MRITETNLWKTASSVKFAIFNLSSLAVVSIAGTIVEQNKGPEYYIDFLGPRLAGIVSLLELDDMYSSWWFIALLTLFAVNLTACTLERLPGVLQQIGASRTDMTTARLSRLPGSVEVVSSLSPDATKAKIEEILQEKKWRVTLHPAADGEMFFAQRGSWTRLGAYIVHIGILLVLAGAIVGKLYGFKTYVQIPEGVFVEGQQENAPIPLPFELRCDSFQIDYYDTGQPRQYSSKMAVIEDGRQVLSRTIAVNDPLQYAGINLYQDNYKEIEGQYILTVTNQGTGNLRHFIVKPHEEIRWPEEGIVFGIAKTEQSFAEAGDGHDHGPRDWLKYQIAYADKPGDPTFFWLREVEPTSVMGTDNEYLFAIRPRYFTGLQVVKDPGVWPVYGGFGIMLFGLFVVFFLSNQKLWLLCLEDGDRSRIIIAGRSNKNKASFERKLHGLVNALSGRVSP